MKMLRYISVIILFLISLETMPQENSCAFKLEEAESLYETGMLDSIPSMLRSCINNDGFDDEELARAYKLLILTYLFEDYIEMAELNMLKFLKEFPEYELKATDPVEFTYLYQSFETIPTFSVGFIGGGNYSMVRIIEPYPTDGSSSSYQGDYSAGLYFQAGLKLNKYITEEIDIELDILYTRKTFDYTNEQLDYITRYTEDLQMLSFPLSGTYDFKLGNLYPYARVGVNLDYIFSAKADLFNDYDNDALDKKDSDVDLMEGGDRNEYHISALLGGGLKFYFKKGYLMLDLRYSYNFTNAVNGENRYNNFKLGKYNYVDDDFAVNNFMFSVGYVIPFYKTKQSK